MSINSKAKLVRIVLGSTVGSLLWAGCAQPRMAVTDPAVIAHAPVDLTDRRPDTNPELRSGFWQMSADRTTSDVVVTPNVTTPDGLPGSADPTYLLGYSAETINSVPPEGQDAIIIEAAGAERNAPRRTWRDRWFRRSTPQNAPSQIERTEEREVIIEGPSGPQAELNQPGTDEVDADEGGELSKSTFVKE